jgi:hypothetical protein
MDGDWTADGFVEMTDRYGNRYFVCAAHFIGGASALEVYDDQGNGTFYYMRTADAEALGQALLTHPEDADNEPARRTTRKGDPR